MCRFHAAVDLFDHLKKLPENDHLSGLKLWKKIERACSLDEAEDALNNLVVWADQSEDRAPFCDWATTYLRSPWLLAITDVGREDNFGLFYTNNASEAAIKHLVPTETKHINVLQFLSHLVTNIARKDVELTKFWSKRYDVYYPH